MLTAVTLPLYSGMKANSLTINMNDTLRPGEVI